MFEEFARALDFPSYFGKNWMALAECLIDLEWLPASSYVLVLQDAEMLLPGDDVSLKTVIEALREAARWWGTASSESPFEDSRPLPFRVLFQVSPEQAAAFAARMTDAGFALPERAVGSVVAP
jgi:hypothetical protein